MFLKIGTTGIVIETGAYSSLDLSGSPPASTVTPVLSVGYVDTSGNRQMTSVIDGVTTITGVAPFFVEFHGDLSVSEQTDSDTPQEAFWNLGFLINYGEALGGNWSVSGRPKDTDRGFPIFAHGYTTVGTHQARMTCRDSAGNQAFIRVNIVVTAPGAGTNMTSGVIPTFTSNTVYNAPAGGTWGNITNQLNGLHNVIIRKSGSGADPVFGNVYLDSRNEPNTAITRSRGIRFLNCDIANLTWGNVGHDYCAAIGGRVRVLTIPNMYYAADQVLAQGMTSQQAQNVRTAKGLLLQDTGQLGDTGGGYVIIGEMRGLHLKNVTSVKATTGNHNIRGVFEGTSFRHCLLNNTVAGSVSYWKFQGWECTTGVSLPTLKGTPDAWPSTDMVVTAAGGRRLGLPSSRVAVVDCLHGLSGSDQPDANAGFGPENNVAEPAQGCELAGFEYCNWFWTTNWYDIDLTGRYLGRRECFLNNGAGGSVNVSTNVNHPNRTPDGWAGPTYTTGTRPVVIP